MRLIPFLRMDEFGVEERWFGSLQSPYDNVEYASKGMIPRDATVSGTCGGVVPATSYGGRPRFTIRGREITREQARQVLLGRFFEPATE